MWVMCDIVADILSIIKGVLQLLQNCCPCDSSATFGEILSSLELTQANNEVLQCDVMCTYCHCH